MRLGGGYHCGGGVVAMLRRVFVLLLLGLGCSIVAGGRCWAQATTRLPQQEGEGAPLPSSYLRATLVFEQNVLVGGFSSVWKIKPMSSPSD
jgi:hypothetical protein